MKIFIYSAFFKISFYRK